jgi:hypothetical protein
MNQTVIVVREQSWVRPSTFALWFIRRTELEERAWRIKHIFTRNAITPLDFVGSGTQALAEEKRDCLSEFHSSARNKVESILQSNYEQMFILCMIDSSLCRRNRFLILINYRWARLWSSFKGKRQDAGSYSNKRHPCVPRRNNSKLGRMSCSRKDSLSQIEIKATHRGWGLPFITYLSIAKSTLSAFKKKTSCGIVEKRSSVARIRQCELVMRDTLTATSYWWEVVFGQRKFIWQKINLAFPCRRVVSATRDAHPLVDAPAANYE